MYLSPPFVNPVSNPIFNELMIRLFWVFVAGAIVTVLLNGTNIRGILKRNLGQRFIGWVILIPLYVLAATGGSIAGMIFLYGITVLALWEACRLCDLPKQYMVTLWLLCIGSLLVTAFKPEYVYALPVIYFSLISIVSVQCNDAKNGFAHASLALFISIWIVFSSCHLILLSQLNNSIDSTRALVLLVIAAVSLSDIGAYLFGKLFAKLGDRTVIASNITPNKTYLGTLGHIFGAWAGIWLLYFAIEKYASLGHWLAMGVIIGVFGMMGGLTNSMLKRFAGVKDSGHLIPGHGGILDRVDSTLRVIIMLYYYLTIVL